MWKVPWKLRCNAVPHCGWPPIIATQLSLLFAHRCLWCAVCVLFLPDDSDVDNPGSIGSRLLSRCRPRDDCRPTLASHWTITATLSPHWPSGRPDCPADRTSTSGEPDDTFLFSTSEVSRKKDNKEIYNAILILKLHSKIHMKDICKKYSSKKKIFFE